MSEAAHKGCMLRISCACLQLVEDLAQQRAGRAGEQEGEHKGSSEARGSGHGRQRRAGAETASVGYTITPPRPRDCPGAQWVAAKGQRAWPGPQGLGLEAQRLARVSHDARAP